MKISVLGSSSRGNCYILEGKEDKLILELGLKLNTIKKALNFKFKGVVGCLVTHEHQDHAKGVNEAIINGFDVFTSQGTIDSLGFNHHRLNPIKDKKQFEVGEFIILPFQTQHDAKEPLGFLIKSKLSGKKILFATDTYYIKYNFKGIDLIMVECNYIQEILDSNIENGKLPKSLRRRIEKSHFSLESLKEFLRASDLSKTKNIVLLHLSRGNADEDRIHDEIEDMTGINTAIANKGITLEF